MNLRRNKGFYLLLAGFFLFGCLGCDYGRMREDEAIDLYEIPMPAMPPGSVPTTGGLNELRAADIDTLSNPLPDDVETIARGTTSYGYYCSHCHGPDASGYGTVGQSFAPLPTDLRSDYVQLQSDGLIFYRISMGFLRHPPLYYTVSEDDRWAIIRYIRSLAKQPDKNKSGKPG